MQRTQPSHGTDLFNLKGGKIFGGSKTPAQTSTRPTTSSGTSTTHSESHPHSSTASVSQRKPSFSVSKGTQRSNSTTRLNKSPDKKRSNSHAHTDRHHPPPLIIPRQDSGLTSTDSFKAVAASAEAVQSPLSGTDSFTSTTPYSNMLARPGTGYQAPGIGGPPLFSITQPPPSPTLETITYQHIQETSSKRISTLDYLRKAYANPQI
jgi:hypothetical protein